MMRRILIACSIDGFSRILRRDLSCCEVYTCSTGPEALEQIEVLHPDLLVIFLSLPYKDGLTVLKESSFKPPAIIALTNLLTNSIINTASDLGVLDLIPIPCSMEYLKDAIHRYL